jgi:hypothetical protein
VVYIPALDVMPAKTSGGRDMQVGAIGAKAEVATVDEVTMREARIRVDGVQVCPACLHCRLSRHAQCDGDLQAWTSYASIASTTVPYWHAAIAKIRATASCLALGLGHNSAGLPVAADSSQWPIRSMH